MYNPRGMWSDGWFNPNPLEAYGFDQYQLKHYCFGGDGDDGGGGGEYGQDDPQDDSLPTPEDFSGLVDAGEMTEDQVEQHMGQAAATMVRTDPYADMIARGIIGIPGQEKSGLTPEEMGFAPRFGYGVHSLDDPSLKQSEDIRELLKTGFRTGRHDPALLTTNLAPSTLSQNALAQSYIDAYKGSQDIGSDIAGLFGFQSPVEFDPNEGFYEGTEFDPFDAPVLSTLAYAINPALGALYGLGTGIAKGDPVGGALSLIGPYSRFAPIARAATGALGAYNTFFDDNQTLSKLAGWDTSPRDTSFNVPRDVYTSSNIHLDPEGYAKKVFQQYVKGPIQNLFRPDPRAGAVASQQPVAPIQQPAATTPLQLIAPARAAPLRIDQGPKEFEDLWKIMQGTPTPNQIDISGTLY